MRASLKWRSTSNNDKDHMTYLLPYFCMTNIAAVEFACASLLCLKTDGSHKTRALLQPCVMSQIRLSSSFLFFSFSGSSPPDFLDFNIQSRVIPWVDVVVKLQFVLRKSNKPVCLFPLALVRQRLCAIASVGGRVPHTRRGRRRASETISLCRR
ncbi:hypothetical protein EJ08DRAFT_173540 [Tothia fuscella]|uniref:Uncharacterized protein n=1 Tax=Tothia fuscella TaxID=1048955 RepID=A0A9P4NT53_9PEZI|nr:hypothetical protein EJ08DRAFT_173540 [Tothia fuscella]